MTKKKETKRVTGYKAFNAGLKCQGFQYKIGETFTTDREIKLCEHGFHFCENPFDVLSYYDLIDKDCNLTEFALVEAVGEVKSDDTKSVTNKISIKSRVDLPGFINEAVKDIGKDSGHSTRNASSGDSTRNASSGDYTTHEVTGKNSIAAAIGRDSLIKGVKGTWIVLAEYKYDKTTKHYEVVGVKSGQIDGKELKENVFYRLANGKFEAQK